MKYRTWLIPVQHAAGALEELNHLVAAHRVVSMDRQFVQDGINSFWAVWVSYEEASARPREDVSRGSGSPRVDYRELLSPDDFSVYVRLRSLRKEVAARDGVPTYAVFTNEQLAEMARRRVNSTGALGEIAGVGPARMEKYADLFLMELRTMLTGSLAVTSGSDE